MKILNFNLCLFLAISSIFTTPYGAATILTQYPADFLLSHYQGNRIIGFGESNHAKFQTLEYLIELLKVYAVGYDPELKIIATEFSHKNQKFLERNSIEEFQDETSLA